MSKIWFLQGLWRQSCRSWDCMLGEHLWQRSHQWSSQSTGAQKELLHDQKAAHQEVANLHPSTKHHDQTEQIRPQSGHSGTREQNTESKTQVQIPRPFPFQAHRQHQTSFLSFSFFSPSNPAQRTQGHLFPQALLQKKKREQCLFWLFQGKPCTGGRSRICLRLNPAAARKTSPQWAASASGP